MSEITRLCNESGTATNVAVILMPSGHAAFSLAAFSPQLEQIQKGYFGGLVVMAYYLVRKYQALPPERDCVLGT